MTDPRYVPAGFFMVRAPALPASVHRELTAPGRTPRRKRSGWPPCPPYGGAGDRQPRPAGGPRPGR
ncbi:hypothetical protein [Planomonospora algeriensis]